MVNCESGQQPQLARRFFDRIEPVHAVTYFAPEARAALDGLGYRGFWMGYFAARSAPFGVVPTEVVTAAFYNFAAERVAEALPARVGSRLACRRIARPRGIGGRRAATLRMSPTRTRPSPPNWRPRRPAAHLWTAARCSPPTGRWRGRNEPAGRLWHAVTLLREHRGDGHVALLTARGVSGRECNVLHAAAGRVPEEMIMRSRDYDDEQWEHYQGRLHAARAAGRRRRAHARWAASSNNASRTPPTRWPLPVLDVARRRRGRDALPEP